MNRIWAPWRIRYVAGDSHPDRVNTCFLCDALTLGTGVKSLVLAQGLHGFVIMNRYPYTCGHLMVCPKEHVGEIDQIGLDVATEMWSLLVFSKQILSRVLHPHGFNVGINQGRCSGAGLTDHLHWHIVPRWDGDHNFMPVLSDIQIIPQALEELFEVLFPGFQSMRLEPNMSGDRNG